MNPPTAPLPGLRLQRHPAVRERRRLRGRPNPSVEIMLTIFVFFLALFLAFLLFLLSRASLPGSPDPAPGRLFVLAAQKGKTPAGQDKNPEAHLCLPGLQPQFRRLIRRTWCFPCRTLPLSARGSGLSGPWSGSRPRKFFYPGRPGLPFWNWALSWFSRVKIS